MRKVEIADLVEHGAIIGAGHGSARAGIGPVHLGDRIDHHAHRRASGLMLLEQLLEQIAA